MKRLSLLVCILVCCASASVRAQYDPLLASTIELCTSNAKSVYAAQEAALTAQAEGHLWLQEEVEETRKLQEEFNAYLDSFRSVLCYVAEAYGLYREAEKLWSHLSYFNAQVIDNPTNLLATALYPKKNSLMTEVVMDCADLIDDIRKACLSSSKMTEKDRAEIIFAIRPKLRSTNKKILRLGRAVRYTSFLDVWYDLGDVTRVKRDNGSIAQSRLSKWKIAARNVQ